MAAGRSAVPGLDAIHSYLLHQKPQVTIHCCTGTSDQSNMGCLVQRAPLAYWRLVPAAPCGPRGPPQSPGYCMCL